jgi:hypothetical protein
MIRPLQRATRRKAFREMLHFHAADWAWLRANDLLELGRPPVRGLDMPVVGRVVKYLQGRAGILMDWPGKPKEDVSDIAAAHAVREQGGLYQDVLQAYLLTPLSFADVGHRVGMPADAVGAYHQTFFDVRSRLSASGWVAAKAVGNKRLVRDPSTLGMVLRKFGYHAGEYIVDKLVAYLLRHHAPQLQLPPPPVLLAECEEQAIKRVLALELLTLDNRNIMLIFHFHADLLLKKKAVGTVNANEIGGNWLAHVTFSGEGNTLRSTLDPEWSPQQEVA